MRLFYLFLFLCSLFFSVLLVSAQPCIEGAARECGYSDVGACSYGRQICQQSAWSICFGAQGPVDEICDDALDNDCDGQIDEGCACTPGETRSCAPSVYEEIGICHYGTESCTSAGEWSDECLNATPPSPAELCGSTTFGNGLDDNCDGQIDEGCAVQSQPGIPSTCFNRVKDADETHVDCGGSCDACNDCGNGIKERDEIRTSVNLGDGIVSDCGGFVCPSCPTCFDETQNQNEDGIDCGGPCSASCVTQEDTDNDQDGLSYRLERQQGTDPENPDTDHDGIFDGEDDLPLCPNAFCDSFFGEDTTNCSEDCVPERTFPVVATVLVFLILALVVFVYFKLKKGGKPAPKQPFKSANQKTVKNNSFSRSSYTKRQSTPRKKKKKEHETDVEKRLRKSLEKMKKL